MSPCANEARRRMTTSPAPVVDSTPPPPPLRRASERTNLAVSGGVPRISHVEERPFRTSQSPSVSPRRGHGRSTTRPSHRQRRPYLDRRFHCPCRSRYLDRSPAARAATFHIGGRSRRGALPRHRQDAASRSPSHAGPAGKQTRCSHFQRERDASAEPRTGDRQPDTAECAVRKVDDWHER